MQSNYRAILTLLLFSLFSPLSAQENNGFPIEEIAPDGATMILEMASSDARLFRLRLINFPQNELIETVTRSGQEEMVFPMQTTLLSERTYTISPAVPGQMGGIASVIVKRPNGENMVINYHWGNQVAGAQ